MRRVLACLLAGLAVTLTAGAAEKAPGMEDCRCGISSTRFSISVGGSWEHYTGENEVTATAGRNIPSATHVDLDLDVAVYFKPSTPSMLFGIALDFANDSWTKDPNFARINQFFVAVKAMYFPQGEAAKGVFVHGDVGPVAFTNQAGNQTGRSQTSTTVFSPLGIGVRLGTGYAFKVSDTVSLLGTADWGYRTAGASTAMPVTLSGGILF